MTATAKTVPPKRRLHSLAVCSDEDPHTVQELFSCLSSELPRNVLTCWYTGLYNFRFGGFQKLGAPFW